MRAIKSNMKDQVLTNDRRILHCPECGGEFSGHVGDYFTLPDDHIFICENCQTEMELVEKVVTVTYIQ